MYDSDTDRELAKAIDRLRADARRAPEAWRGWFADLERSVFDPSLRVTELRRAHRLRSAQRGQEFAEHFGCGPAEYVTRVRVEAALVLVSGTSLETYKIARRVGFASRSSLDKAFVRHLGRPPSAYRVEKALVGHLVAPEGRSLRRRLFALALEPEDAARQIEILRIEYAELEASEGGDREQLERSVAVAWWPMIRHLPPEKRRENLRAGLFETPAMFEELHRQSQLEGHDDRLRGVEIAELALLSLSPLRGRVDERVLLGLEARAWTQLGDARRKLSDDAGARAAYERAHACRARLADR